MKLPVSTSQVARGALFAAVYAAVTLAFAPISFGPVQFRVAEALTVAPFLFPEAVPGLFLGCALANAFGGLGLVDLFFGSLATLAAALLSMVARNRFQAALAPVLINGLVVGGYLSYLTGMWPVLSIFYVAAGEAGACFALGYPLLGLLAKLPGARQRPEG
jgi:uncharacterized membrane protein